MLREEEVHGQYETHQGKLVVRRAAQNYQECCLLVGAGGSRPVKWHKSERTYLFLNNEFGLAPLTRRKDSMAHQTIHCQ